MARVTVRLELEDGIESEVGTEFAPEKFHLDPEMLVAIVHRTADAVLRAAGQS